MMLFPSLEWKAAIFLIVCSHILDSVIIHAVGLDSIAGSIMGFEPLVNQRLLPPSFPRYTAIFGRPQVSKHVLLIIYLIIVHKILGAFQVS